MRTNILSDEAFSEVEELGVQLATAEDAGQCLLRILSDASINGHMFFVSARKWAPSGFIDLDLDDYAGNPLVQEMVEAQMKNAPASAGLFAWKA